MKLTIALLMTLTMLGCTGPLEDPATGDETAEVGPAPATVVPPGSPATPPQPVPVQPPEAPMPPPPAIVPPPPAPIPAPPEGCPCGQEIAQECTPSDDNTGVCHTFEVCSVCRDGGK
jgi:hypothetical protein